MKRQPEPELLLALRVRPRPRRRRPWLRYVIEALVGVTLGAAIVFLLLRAGYELGRPAYPSNVRRAPVDSDSLLWLWDSRTCRRGDDGVPRCTPPERGVRL